MGVLLHAIENCCIEHPTVCSLDMKKERSPMNMINGPFLILRSISRCLEGIPDFKKLSRMRKSRLRTNEFSICRRSKRSGSILTLKESSLEKTRSSRNLKFQLGVPKVLQHVHHILHDMSFVQLKKPQSFQQLYTSLRSRLEL